MNEVVISGAGLWTPEHTITNEELVESYNAWIVVRPAGEGSRIEWGSTFDAKGVDDETAQKAVEGMYGVLIGWVLDGATQG